MSKHEIDSESDEKRRIATSDQETFPRRSHPPSDTSHERDSVDTAELTAGDVVLVDRSIGEIHALTYATVVAVDSRGPRLGGPDYPTPTYANALRIDRVTSYDRLVGRDGDGSYHLLRRDPGGHRVLSVISTPGAEPEYQQAIADDGVLVLWVEHIDAKRGWDSVAEQFVDLLEDGERP